MSNRSILLLEDDPSLIRLIEVNSVLLDSTPWRRGTVGEAWKEAQERHFDAAIVDLHLPGVHGWNSSNGSAKIG